jgi:hypothetical protein
MKRGLFYFILFDFVIASIVIFNFSLRDKYHEHGIIAPLISFFDITPHLKNTYPYIANNKDVIQLKLTISPIHNLNENIPLNTITPPIKNNITIPVCIVYGPLNLEEKSELDVIMSESSIPSDLVSISQIPLFEIYWNLGSNKIHAMNLFEEQKNNGALQDERFKLSQEDDGNWIISITTVSGDIKLAQTMTAQLGEASKQYGGTWQYRSKNNGYFYKFKDITKIPDRTINIINHSLNVLKVPC